MKCFQNSYQYYLSFHFYKKPRFKYNHIPVRVKLILKNRGGCFLIKKLSICYIIGIFLDKAKRVYLVLK